MRTNYFLQGCNNALALEEPCPDCETNEKKLKESEDFFGEVLRGLMKIFPAVKEGFEDLSPEDTFGSSDLLEHISRDVDDLTKRAEQAEVARSKLAEWASGDIRTPMHFDACDRCPLHSQPCNSESAEHCKEKILAWAREQTKEAT